MRRYGGRHRAVNPAPPIRDYDFESYAFVCRREDLGS